MPIRYKMEISDIRRFARKLGRFIYDNVVKDLKNTIKHNIEFGFIDLKGVEALKDITGESEWEPRKESTLQKYAGMESEGLYDTTLDEEERGEHMLNMVSRRTISSSGTRIVGSIVVTGAHDRPWYAYKHEYGGMEGSKLPTGTFSLRGLIRKRFSPYRSSEYAPSQPQPIQVAPELEIPFELSERQSVHIVPARPFVRPAMAHTIKEVAQNLPMQIGRIASQFGVKVE